MLFDTALSPGVARAVEAAYHAAQAEGRGIPSAANLLHGLLAEPEGRPMVLLARFGLRVEQFAIPDALGGIDAARIADRLHAFAGAEITTDRMLAALLDSAPALCSALADAGLNVADLQAFLHGQQSSPTEVALPVELRLEDLPEFIDAARILDAAANRAREALRVLDDYARFARNDQMLTAEIKTFRHDLVAVLEELPWATLLRSRDTVGDVGTSVTAGREYERSTPRRTAFINLKRLQEALRSLEEFGKLFAVSFAASIEQLRYRSYTLERLLVLTDEARSRLSAARLYLLLTGSQCVNSLEWTIERAAAGGVSIVQLREKDLPDRELLMRAKRVREWTRAAGLLLIVNDRPDIARLVEADGVHLGQDDMPVRAARRIVGPDALIGVSTHNVDQVRQAVRDGADYLGAGPTFPSTTKAFPEFPGLAFLLDARAETDLPVFAIGGINPTTIDELTKAGIDRAAVSAAIAQADDPESVARLLADALARVGPRKG